MTMMRIGVDAVELSNATCSFGLSYGRKLDSSAWWR